MKAQKITFILSLLGILLLIFLTQTTKQTQIATIKSIQSSNNRITIQIENNSVELIIFDAPFTNLKKGDIIEFQGHQNIYKNKTQIIIDKLKNETTLKRVCTLLEEKKTENEKNNIFNKITTLNIS